MLFVGCAPHARRTFIGSWEETATTNSFVHHRGQELGYFTFTQQQHFRWDQLHAANLQLRYTNTTDSHQSFNYRINFQLRTVSQRSHYTSQQTFSQRERRNGYWTYEDAIVRVPPNSSVSVGLISDRVVDIQQGTIGVSIR